MNPSKSEILNINVQKREEQAYKNEFLFTWKKKELKYLGDKIT